jgi:hypothetical protein
MTAKVRRDWRGVKHRLGEYSTADLAVVLANVEVAREQISHFAEAVAAELARRESGSGSPAA